MTYTVLYDVGGCKTKSGIKFPSTDEILIDQAASKIYLLSSISKSYIVHAEIPYKGKLNVEKLKRYDAKRMSPFRHNVALQAESLDELTVLCEDIQITDEIDSVLVALIEKD